MAFVEIYEKPLCPYCCRAKALLTRKKVSFSAIDVSRDAKRRDEMIRRADGRYTVPQIFIDGIHVGGCDDLHALERGERLDAILAGLPANRAMPRGPVADAAHRSEKGAMNTAFESGRTSWQGRGLYRWFGLLAFALFRRSKRPSA